MNCLGLPTKGLKPNHDKMPQIFADQMNKKYKILTGVFIILFGPPAPGVGAKIWPNTMLGENIIKRGRKKGGKCIFFPNWYIV